MARLRDDGDAILSLVAVQDAAIVGHVMLSPMSAPFRALGLAPLSVLPRWQRQGVGTALLQAAIGKARDGGWSAVFVLGDPAYYRRFGFRADLAAGFTSPYAGPHLNGPAAARCAPHTGRPARLRPGLCRHGLNPGWTLGRPAAPRLRLELQGPVR